VLRDVPERRRHHHGHDQDRRREHRRRDDACPAHRGRRRRSSASWPGSGEAFPDATAAHPYHPGAACRRRALRGEEASRAEARHRDGARHPEHRVGERDGRPCPEMRRTGCCRVEALLAEEPVLRAEARALRDEEWLRSGADRARACLRVERCRSAECSVAGWALLASALPAGSTRSPDGRPEPTERPMPPGWRPRAPARPRPAARPEPRRPGPRGRAQRGQSGPGSPRGRRPVREGLPELPVAAEPLAARDARARQGPAPMLLCRSVRGPCGSRAVRWWPTPS
jgi:hypothetical protein